MKRLEKELLDIKDGARLWVKAHEKKRFVIALRYEGEQEDRYIAATNTTWRMTDIAEAYIPFAHEFSVFRLSLFGDKPRLKTRNRPHYYSLLNVAYHQKSSRLKSRKLMCKGYTIRWLVEVFFSDWKQYEGWCQMAKQPGVDGSNRGLILSLLTDHALLLHPEQKALLKHKLPACTVGSLREQICFDAIIKFIGQIIDSDDPVAQLSECVEQIKKVLVLSPSRKHLNHRTLGHLVPTDSLKYKAAA